MEKIENLIAAQNRVVSGLTQVRKLLPKGSVRHTAAYAAEVSASRVVKEIEAIYAAMQRRERNVIE